MFEVISNPFVEMAQGVVSNGLGYVAKKSVKSFGWLWWLLLPIIVLLGIFLLLAHQHKKKVEEQKKVDEEKEEQKFIDQQTKNTLE